jgi:DNA-directed RNA polymerase subunit RPC12/RpoP
MAGIELPCTGCGQVLEAPEEMAGQAVECPECGALLTVPEVGGQAGAPKSASKKCPECGSDMEQDAVLCINCGFHQKLGKKINTQFS